MLEIMTIIGARPQFVKAAVLSRLFRSEKYRGRIHETLVHTGQHYDENMSDVFFREMEIPTPDINLNSGSGSHGAMTALMLSGIERLITERKTDVLLVYGDTNSTLAGAIAASKLHIPIAHVESGLRSYMMAMPEEQNRRLTDHLSTWLFCPTTVAVENLRKEGIVHCAGSKPDSDNKSVTMTGDIMLDASTYYRTNALAKAGYVLENLPQKFYLLTIHRAENTDDPLRLASIVEAINSVPDKHAVFPIHPRTRKIMREQGLAFKPHVHLLDPVGYYEMLCLESACTFVLTDSGGVQKEAFFLKKPCATMRDSTEWVELVDSGWNILVGADTTAIVRAINEPLSPVDYPDLYGNGNSSLKIIETLLTDAN